MHGLRCKYVIILILALATPAFSLEWYKAYEKGQNAIKKGDCATGKAMMLEALKGNPKAEMKAHPYGTYMLEYLPQFYLFQCAVQEGDFAAAQDYGKQAESAGVYASSHAAEYRQLKSKIPQQPSAKPPTTPEVIPANPNKPPENNTNTNPPTQQPANPDLNKQAQAQKALKEAKDALSAGDFDRARMALYSYNALSPNTSEGRKLSQDIDRAEQAQQQDREKREKLDQASRALRSGDLITAASLVAELKVKYPGDSQVQSLSNEIQKKRDAQIANESQSTQKRTLERQVVVAFYKGQYNAVIELAQQGLQKTPDSWHLYFFLGCSYASLSILDHNDEQNLKLARDSFARAKSLDGSAAPPPYISPKILKIYNNS